jgi:4-aminobutyrate aminotransferase-like enzyme
MTSGLELLAPVWTHLTTMQPVRAEGVYFYDAEGRSWLDFTSGSA